VLWLPEPAPSLAPAAAANLASTELKNAVSAVLVAYRAIDTLQEKVVLLRAIIGVWSLAPDHFWGGRPGQRQPRDADGVLAFLGQLLPPAGIVISVYSVWVSAADPGGAFQGGTILAAMWRLARTASLTDAPPIERRWLRAIVIGGPTVFLVIGLAGFVIAGHFLAYPIGFAKPLIVIIEAALTLSIAALLALLVAGPPERAPDA
jgi:multisubunit Na+/H+ antiporter MnhB subunit